MLMVEMCNFSVSLILFALVSLFLSFTYTVLISLFSVFSELYLCFWAE